MAGGGKRLERVVERRVGHLYLKFWAHLTTEPRRSEAGLGVERRVNMKWVAGGGERLGRVGERRARHRRPERRRGPPPGALAVDSFLV